MINKDIIKKIIVENKEYIENLSIIHRDYQTDPRANYVVTGIRRGGKSFLLYDLIQASKIKNQSYSYASFSFEDERLMEIKIQHLDLLVECAIELCGKKPTLYFDEIHNIGGWEKFVRRLADTGYQVCITGSNAKMLGNDISSVLGGRFLIKEVMPLSFNEFLLFKQVKVSAMYEFSEQRFELKKHLGVFLKYGGFPEWLKYQYPKEYLGNIFMKVFYGDLIARYHIQNEYALKLLIKKIAESVNNVTSINRFKNIIASTGATIGNSTIHEYLGYLKEAYLIYGISNFTAKFSDRETKKKYYFIDQGILNLFILDQDTKLLENMVFVELLRRYKENIYYYKRKVEVDFYIPAEELLIQVSYTISQPETKQREIAALQKAMLELGLKKALLITMDEKETIQKDGTEIEVIPVWNWLLKS